MISKNGTNDMIEQENYSDNTCVMEQAITVINDTKSDMIWLINSKKDINVD